MKSDLDEQIVAALQQVCDPCSIAANAPLSIIDMGLIRGWSLDPQGNLVVRMCLTSPSCTMSPHMVRAAHDLLAVLPGITSARIEVDPSVFWTPDDMTEAGRELLQARRQASRTNTKVTPRQWRSPSPQDDA